MNNRTAGDELVIDPVKTKNNKATYAITYIR